MLRMKLACFSQASGFSPVSYTHLDHLGYRLALTGLETDGDLQPGGVLHVKLSLVNYGFAAAFQMESGFVLLDSCLLYTSRCV